MKIFKKAIWLLAVTGILSGHACSSDNGEEPTKENPKSEVPTELTGNWMDSWSWFMQYNFDPLLYDPDAKVWFRGSYDAWSMDPRPGFGLQIDQSGNFIWTVVVSTNTGGCQVYTAEYLKGTVEITANKITFHSKVRRKKYHSVCNPGNNFDRDEDKGSFSLTFKITDGESYNGHEVKVLTLINPDGSEVAYSQTK
ncbi:hypothetical protein SAMN04487891_107223 [Flagellimonas taeanensis]|uniref:Lipoprotein n=1 Tax=Flagellimonas taeanensis TaxID=1005926 RepID=A0A1M6UUW8_9FLAO|nr:hypothetical protein [Allomuricauda taeanensis]SFC23377.1 hypothetical protein SAMN04487891_107223 [Allomuricauda taeanensis]SHK72911.1 hypothetical protein SAMN05216293_1782 [Allomuricauda taeanensis]